MEENTDMKESVKVLHECIKLQTQKSADYQNPNSIIKQADYYPSGCLTILEIMHAKLLRMRSVMEAMQNDKFYQPNFESLEDSAKDLINYASFYVSYSRGKMEGQDEYRDFINKPVARKEKPLPELAVRNPNAKPTPIDWTGLEPTIPETGGLKPLYTEYPYSDDRESAMLSNEVNYTGRNDASK